MIKQIPGIFYQYLHSKLLEIVGGSIISEKEVKKILFQWKIPKNLRVLIIREMEMLELIVKEGRYNIRLLRPNFNDEKIRKYYTTFKIF